MNGRIRMYNTLIDDLNLYIIFIGRVNNAKLSTLSSSGRNLFFTVNLLERYSNDLLIRHIAIFRTVVQETRKRWPFILMLGLFCRNIYIVCGHYPLGMMTMPTVGE